MSSNLRAPCLPLRRPTSSQATHSRCSFSNGWFLRLLQELVVVRCSSCFRQAEAKRTWAAALATPHQVVVNSCCSRTPPARRPRMMVLFPALPSSSCSANLRRIFLSSLRMSEFSTSPSLLSCLLAILRIYWFLQIFTTTQK